MPSRRCAPPCMASSDPAFTRLGAPAAPPAPAASSVLAVAPAAYTCTPMSACMPCPADDVRTPACSPAARLPVLPPVQQPPGGAVRRERQRACPPRLERLRQVYWRRGACVQPVCLRERHRGRRSAGRVRLAPGAPDAPLPRHALRARPRPQRTSPPRTLAACSQPTSHSTTRTVRARTCVRAYTHDALASVRSTQRGPTPIVLPRSQAR